MGASLPAFSSNIVGVSPITDRIVQLHFDDGHIDYTGRMGGGNIYNDLLDTTAIYNLGNYVITSPTDGDFANGRNPTHIGRKTKAGEVNNKDSSPEFILEHWVYIQLPDRMKQGNTYTISLGGLAGNTNTVTFSFDAGAIRSDAVHVTQTGFTPEAPKYAYISQWMGDFANGTIVDGKGEFPDYEGKRFDVVRVSDGVSVYNGTVAARKRYRDGSPQTNNGDDARTFWWPCGCDYGQNHSFSDVLEADFSSLTAPGEYRVVVQDMGRSYAFEIGTHAYRDPFNYILRGIGFQRQGVVLDLPDGRIRPRDYHPDDYPEIRYRYASKWRWVDAANHSAKDENDEPIDKGFNGTSLPVWGWYHDAGDWDTYPMHGFIPLMLNILYDYKPDNFRDGDIGMRYKLKESDANWIDEGNNGIPDILDEAAWLMRYWRRAKDVGVARGITTGGVPGAYGGADAGALDGFPSWDDNDRPLEFTAEGPFATYQYAAVAAQYAYNMRSLGRNGEAADWLNEARNAWTWANNNNSGDDNTSFYGIGNKMRSVAAAALYKATGEDQYQQRLKDMFAIDNQYNGYEEGWGSPHYWEIAAAIYGPLSPSEYGNLDQTFQTSVKEHITTTADQNFVDPAAQRGYRYGFDDRKAQEIGMGSTPMILTVIAAAEVSDDPKYVRTAHTTNAFFLGGNQDHKSWISGLGENPVRYPFHPNSWFLYDFDSKVYSDEILPGYVPYGITMQPDFFGWGYFWGGDEDFTKTSMYPYYEYQNWPAMEQRMGTRYSIPSSEFTVWQNMATSAFAYGYFNAPAGSDYQFNDRPTVTLNAAQSFPADGGTLSVSASGDTRRVEYYYEENYIGESMNKAGNFAFFWDPPLPAGTNGIVVTAVAYDDKGLISLPSGPGDKTVNIVAGNSVAVTSITISPATLTLANVGNTGNLTATISPANATNRTVFWSSSNAAVASVDANGRVTGVGNGVATITATTQDGSKTDRATVTVGSYTAVTGVSVSPTSVALVPGRQATLTATVSPSNASVTNVTWQSSNPGVVSVDAGGRVTGVGLGSATVTATTEDGGRTASATIAVTDLSCIGDLLNPSFDNGLANWTVNSGTVATTGGDLVLTGPDAGVEQQFDRTLATGTNVVVRFRSSVSDAGGAALVGLDFIDAAGNKTNVQREIDATAEQEFTINGDAPAGTVRLGVWMYTQTNVLTVDNFCVDVAGSQGGGNPPGGGADFVQDSGPDGLVSMETEEHSSMVGAAGYGDWTEMSDVTASKGAYMVVPNDSGTSLANGANAANGARLDFVVDFVKTGTHYVWIRQRSPNGADNSVNFGYNGIVFTEWNMPDALTEWTWSRAPRTFEVAATGTNTFNVYMRENGTPIDLLLLTTNPGFDPNASAPMIPAADFVQDDGPAGIVSLEAEQRSAMVAASGDYADWVEIDDATADNGAFMIVPNDAAGSSLASGDNAAAGAHLDFDIEFVKTGPHYVWIRQRSPNGSDNSVNFGFNGSVYQEWNMPDALTEWTWSRSGITFDVPATGMHTFNVFMRENGTPVDHLILTTDANYDPARATASAQADGTVRLETADELALRPQIDLYPNPSADGWLQLKAAVNLDAMVEVITTSGQIVSRIPYRGSEARVHIKQSGLYVIRVVQDEDVLAVHRVVVK